MNNQDPLPNDTVHFALFIKPKSPRICCIIRYIYTFTYETNKIQSNDRGAGIYMLPHIAMPSRDEIKKKSDGCLLLELMTHSLKPDTFLYFIAYNCFIACRMCEFKRFNVQYIDTCKF